MGCEEEASQIIEKVARSGLRISRRQLAAWHRAGLVPTPTKRGVGRGSGQCELLSIRFSISGVGMCSSV